MRWDRTGWLLFGCLRMCYGCAYVLVETATDIVGSQNKQPYNRLAMNNPALFVINNIRMLGSIDAIHLKARMLSCHPICTSDSAGCFVASLTMSSNTWKGRTTQTWIPVLRNPSQEPMTSGNSVCRRTIFELVPLSRIADPCWVMHRSSSLSLLHAQTFTNPSMIFVGFSIFLLADTHLSTLVVCAVYVYALAVIIKGARARRILQHLTHLMVLILCFMESRKGILYKV
jgi:hypothetical protein